MVLTLETVEPTNKFQPKTHFIENNSGDSVVSSFSIGVTPQDKINVSIGFNALQHQTGVDHLKQTIADLLADRNYEIEAESGGEFFLTFKDVDVGDLTAIVGTLSQSVDLGQGKTAYAVLDKKIVLDLAEIEQEILEGADLFSVKRSESYDGDKQYIDYNSNIPGALVSTVKQDSRQAEGNGEPISFETTNIYLGDDPLGLVKGSIQKAGLDFNSNDSMIAVDGTIKEVSQALANIGAIPAAAVESIESQFDELRPHPVIKSQIDKHSCTVGSPSCHI